MGRPPSLDVPLTIMTRKDQLNKGMRTIDKLYKETFNVKNKKTKQLTITRDGQQMKVTHL